MKKISKHSKKFITDKLNCIFCVIQAINRNYYQCILEAVSKSNLHFSNNTQFSEIDSDFLYIFLLLKLNFYYTQSFITFIKKVRVKVKHSNFRIFSYRKDKIILEDEELSLILLQEFLKNFTFYSKILKTEEMKFFKNYYKTNHYPFYNKALNSLNYLEDYFFL